MQIKIYNFKPGSGQGQIMAFCDLIVGDICICSCRVVKTANGVSVFMPSNMSAKGKSYQMVRILSKDLQNQINEKVLAAYYDWYARTYIPGFSKE